MEQHPAVVESESEIVSLPVGQVGHATATHASGETYDDYYFADAEHWFRLRCESTDQTENGWRSIAETFEFLPVEDSAETP